MASVAVLFAGQGAQAVGMGKDLYDRYADCKALFERADAVLGLSLSKICFEGPEEELLKTSHCQPAIFVVSMACYKALCLEAGSVVPVGTAGLSLGEWTALHAAGVLSFDDTLKVLAARGRYMQEACEQRSGGMVSVIGLSREKLAAICAATGAGMANINSDEQIVLSGGQAEVQAAGEAAKAAGAKKVIPLKVAGAYHSSLMSSAAEKLAALLKDVPLAAPSMPVLSNVTGKPHGSPEEIRRQMVQQVTGSVLWVDCVRYLAGQGVTRYVECGPGKVLGGLVKRIDGNAGVFNVEDGASLAKTVQGLAAG